MAGHGRATLRTWMLLASVGVALVAVDARADDAATSRPAPDEAAAADEDAADEDAADEDANDESVPEMTEDEEASAIATDLILLGITGAVAPLIIGAVVGATGFSLELAVGAGLVVTPYLLAATGIWVAFALPLGAVLAVSALRRVPTTRALPAALAAPLGASLGLGLGLGTTLGLLYLVDVLSPGGLPTAQTLALLFGVLLAAPLLIGGGGAVGGGAGVLAGYLGGYFGLEPLLTGGGDGDE